MTTEQIQYLQAIFREGSLNRAAKSLGLSQSTMSKSLQSLERELGVSLFLRVQGRLMPTRQGYVVLDMVQKISGLQEQMVKCLNIFRSERGDSITMGFPFYWNYASFAPVLETSEISPYFLPLSASKTPQPIISSTKYLPSGRPASDRSI